MKTFPRFQLNRFLAGLALAATAALAPGQDLPPGEPQRDPNDDLVMYELYHVPQPGVKPKVEILEIDKVWLGATLVFHGEDEKDYMVWRSKDMRGWSYATMAGQIGPQLYSAHVEQNTDAGQGFFLVMEVEDGEVVNPEQVLNELIATVAFFDELEQDEREVFVESAGRLVNALAEKAQKENALAVKLRQLARCKADVEALRLAAEAATAAVAQAESEVDTASQELGTANAMIPHAQADLDAKRANLAEWEGWAPSELAELEGKKAAATSDIERNNIQGQIDVINTALDRRRQRVAEAEAVLAALRADRANAQNRLNAATAAHTQAVIDEVGAQAAHEAAKDSCRPCEEAVQEAQDQLRAACDRVTEATRDFNNAGLVANEQADRNIEARKRREANQQIQVNAQEAQRRAAQDARARADLERNLAEWKKFLDAIRAYAGAEEAKRVAETIAQGLQAGGIGALQVTAGALKALALGQSVAQAIGGMVINGLQVGYGALVAYAQSVAVNAVVKIASGAVAKMLKEMSNLKPGESRFHNMKSGFYLVIRNANKTFTVFSYTKNYFRSGGTFGVHVLK